MPIEVFTRSEIPDSTDLYLSADEDTTGDGSPDNSSDITQLSGGDEIHKFNGIDGGGNDVSLVFTFENVGDLHVTPTVHASAYRTVSSSWTLTWESASDWDGAQSSEYIVHESFGDHSSDQLQVGYDPSEWPSLIHYWPLHEESGSTAADVVGDVDGTYNSMISYSNTAVFGDDAPGFDGSSSHIQFDANTGTNSISDNEQLYTFSIWIYPHSLSQSRGDIVRGSAGTPNLWLYIDSGTLYCRADGQMATYDLDSSYVNSWTHVAVRLDNSQGIAELFVDGVSAGSGTPGAGGIGTNLYIGSQNGSDNFYDGELDEAMFFSSFLGSSDITDLSVAPREGQYFSDKRTS